MTAAQNSEPTRQDLANKLDKLSTDLDKISTANDQFNDRCIASHKTIQGLVQIAFTLIASATLTVIIASVLRQ